MEKILTGRLKAPSKISMGLAKLIDFLVIRSTESVDSQKKKKKVMQESCRKTGPTQFNPKATA